MKGVLIVGGQGTRLHPFTQALNKHLALVGKDPMFFHPLRSMHQAGIEEVMIVCGGRTPGQFLELAGDGRRFGLSVCYGYQEEPDGIAGALRVAEAFTRRDNCLLMLGDTILNDSLWPFVEAFLQQGGGARILAQQVPDPERCAVLSFDGAERLVEVTEKPPAPPSQWGVLGAYCFDPQVWDFLRRLQPSARGQYEVTDLHRCYLRLGQLQWEPYLGDYADAGTFAGLRRANEIAWEMCGDYE